jgi:nitrite reductase (NO-forming)
MGSVPLHFNVKDHVRFFLLNAGDTLVNFHIVGQQIQQVTQGGPIEKNVQTFNLGGSNSAIVDVTFNQAGTWVIVDHDYSQLFKGRVAIISVDNNVQPNSNPSNAVPPMGVDSLPQGHTIPYTFGTPLPPDCLVNNGGMWTISPDPSCSDQKAVANGGTVDTNPNNQ